MDGHQPPALGDGEVRPLQGLTGKMLRLYPLPVREVSAIYEDLDLGAARPRDASRPYVILNMVGSVDGRAAVEGKASGLGSETDRQTMRTLRARADAVMVGAGTLRAERLTLGLDARAGPQPLAVIATTSGAIPLEANLIVKEGQRVLVMAREDTAVRHGEHGVLGLEDFERFLEAHIARRCGRDPENARAFAGEGGVFEAVGSVLRRDHQYLLMLADDEVAPQRHVASLGNNHRQRLPARGFVEAQGELLGAQGGCPDHHGVCPGAQRSHGLAVGLAPYA